MKIENRKIITLLAIVTILLISMTACGGNSGTNETAPPQNQNTSSNSGQTNTPTPTEPEQTGEWMIPLNATGRAIERNIIAAGGEHSLAVMENGTLMAWGLNESYQLGDGTTNNTNIPLAVMDNVVSVYAGYTHSMAITSDGVLWVMGNTGGTMGVDRGPTVYNTPTRFMESVVAASAGTNHSMAIRADSSLWAWGDNFSGRLGDGTTERQLNPVRIMENVVSVAAGPSHTFAITEDGGLWSWGRNLNGVLGDGTEEDRHSPVRILENITTVATGHSFGLALDNEGNMWAWGSVGNGGFGGSAWHVTTTPEIVAEGIIAMDAHTANVASVVNAFAINQSNQLIRWQNGDIRFVSFDGSRRSSNQHYFENVIDVSAGLTHALAMTHDGELWVWGSDEHGKLGTGLINDTHPAGFERSSPTLIMNGLMLP